MFRRSLVVPFVLALLPVAAAAAWVLSPAFFDIVPASRSPEPQADVQQAALAPPELEALQPRENSDVNAPSFDVVRISSGGVSVFAGTAPPNSTVTVTADPRLLARFEEKAQQWRIEDGNYRVALARSAQAPVLTAEARLDPRLFGN